MSLVTTAGAAAATTTTTITTATAKATTTTTTTTIATQKTATTAHKKNCRVRYAILGKFSNHDLMMVGAFICNGTIVMSSLTNRYAYYNIFGNECRLSRCQGGMGNLGRVELHLSVVAALIGKAF